MLGGHSDFDDVLKTFNFELNQQFHVYFSTLDCEVKLSFISQTLPAEVLVLRDLEI